MTEIRQRAGGFMITVLVIAFGGLWALQDSGAFDAVGMGRDARVIGTVDGIDIEGELYNRALEQQLQAYQQQGIPISSQLQRQIEDQLFDEFVANAIVEREMDRLGVEVTDDEVFALITGPNPDPLIAQLFPDGQGGVDRAALQQVVEDPQYAQQLQAVEEQIRRNRRQAKLAALLGATARVTEAEVEAEFVRQRRQAAAEFVGLRYADVPDSEVEMTDADLQAYYRANEPRFERPGRYTVEYVAFDQTPTAADSARATDELAALVEGFRQAPDPVAYAQRNAFGASVEPRLFSRAELPPDLATAVFRNAEAGRVVGPVVAGSQAVLARITDVVQADTTQQVELVTITRPVEGDFNRVLEQAQDFQAFIEIEGQSFAEAAAEQGTEPTRVQVQEDNPTIPGLDLGRDFVRFLRNADVGDVSDPIDAGGSFLVARLVESQEAGVAPFEEVRDQVETAVLLEKKEAVQTARLQAAAEGTAPLSAIAQAVGAQVRQADGVTFANPTIAGYGVEPRAVGAAFGLQPGQRSGVIPGEQAAFVIRTTALRGATEGELTEELRQQIRLQLLQRKRQRVLQGWLEGLRDEAEVEDFRNEVL